MTRKMIEKLNGNSNKNTVAKAFNQQNTATKEDENNKEEKVMRQRLIKFLCGTVYNFRKLKATQN